MRLIPVSQPALRHVTVEVRVPRRACRRWHRWLVEALLAQGHRVSLRICDGPADEVAGLELLGFVERMLYQHQLGEETDASAVIEARDWVGGPAADRPEVIFDCSTTDGPYPETGEVLLPSFDGMRSLAGLVGSLIGQREPLIGWRRKSDGALVAGGRAALAARHILTATLAQSLALMPGLGARALADTMQAGAVTAPGAVSANLPAGHLAITRFGLANLADRLSRRLRETLTTPRQWSVAWRRVAPEQGLVAAASFDPTCYTWLPRDPARYFADPFLFEHQGGMFLFCEEFPHATGRGLISVMEWTGNGFGTPRPVLERPYHLSYPCVFRHGSEIWMIPETTAAGTLELYRATDFPDRWSLHGVIAEGINAADATVFKHDGLIWIAAGTAAPGSSDRDQLSLFFAESLEGPWQQHPLNPVVVDAFGARPAGGWQSTPSGWRRPAQDCSGGYGWGLSLRRIDRLDRERFAETELIRFPPPAVLDATGFHTVNVGGGLETIDALKP
ncbi:MAG TPA: hypothetical protein PLQ11_04800 [Beijerinckiaceae bacterium]|nr:hypothetical protein [Beijerinckiaceae bacterium]